MPLRLNVGVSRKIGLPEYSSAGASCHIELELEARLLESDLPGFHAQVRDAYLAAHQAVDDELARLQGQDPPACERATAGIGHDRHGSPENGRGQINGCDAR